MAGRIVREQGKTYPHSPALAAAHCRRRKRRMVQQYGAHVLKSTGDPKSVGILGQWAFGVQLGDIAILAQGDDAFAQIDLSGGHAAFLKRVRAQEGLTGLACRRCPANGDERAR